MARNEEKAMSMLNRWLRVQSGEDNKKKERRPYSATMVESLPEAEKWRRQIVGVITKKVAEIQNPGLGEFKIRDLNDQINRLCREKTNWERRIIELGGPNYLKSSSVLDADGKEVPGTKGYKYFGAAKDLPGVRELFKSDHETPAAKRSRTDMYKCADASYFGYRDEDDTILLPLENAAEQEAVAQAVLEWTERQEKGGVQKDDDDEDEPQDKSDSFVAHVAVPSREELERAALAAKKRQMLAQYVSQDE
ncbi:hypothetical protein GUITHDRAFT_93281 [Guillardia theta CCMP2712]|uniref:Pre-mRNA-splicing factor ISY1 n=2 Tax=Guillardia theta TaxID=55529 RepID=L1JN49_GUITC|nr:hypothetical protein GUITHDRAFT_93281 [Guillardia theta CCMP2712]EKX49704.1 hypothetical protein GUITHDRAFT_93281 [Guillardia theta CCMP2712]|eukprot:XP_005836684.1 hypothetical protein GUITHDRAFT_93281 [Guillardia theta CCMP2712]